MPARGELVEQLSGLAVELDHPRGEFVAHAGFDQHGLLPGMDDDEFGPGERDCCPPARPLFSQKSLGTKGQAGGQQPRPPGLNSVLIRTGSQNVLIETGVGNKLSERMIKITANRHSCSTSWSQRV